MSSYLLEGNHIGQKIETNKAFENMNNEKIM